MFIDMDFHNRPVVKVLASKYSSGRFQLVFEKAPRFFSIVQCDAVRVRRRIIAWCPSQNDTNLPIQMRLGLIQ